MIPLQFEVDAWLLIGLLIPAGLLTWFAYRRTEPGLEGVYQWILPGLRGTVLMLLLVLLLEPVWHQAIRKVSQPVQVVLVDESLSISQHQRPEVLPPLGGEIYYFGFGGATRPLENFEAAMDTAPRTDIAQALNEIKHLLQNKNLHSVLLVSDGQYNTGRNPIYTAADYGVPIHTLIVGDTLQPQDLSIARISTNELAYVGQEIPVDVTLLLQGYTNETVTTHLIISDSLIAGKTTAISEGEATVSLRFTPSTEGLLQYSLTTTELEQEATWENNRTTFAVRVLKRNQSICLIAAAPHPDLTAIRNILTRDPMRQVDSYVQMQPGKFYEGELPSSLDQYDVLILVGFPGREADPTSINQVVQAAESGTPLLFMLTRQTDLAYLLGSFRTVLPVIPTANSMLYDEALLQLTTAGIRDAILDVPKASWEQFPPLMATTGHWSATSDSRILGQANVRGISLDEPLFVIRSRAGHRTASILGAGTWRWLNHAGGHDDIWPQVVENLMQWLTTPEDDRIVRVEPTQTVFDGSEPIDFVGQVYDESFKPVSDAVVTLELLTPDNAVYPYSMTHKGSGRFALRIDALPEGTYSYTAQATRKDAPLGTDQGVFTVGSVNLEYRSTQSDAALLRQIAYRSGGHFFTDHSLHTLPGKLASDSLFTATSYVQQLEFDLRKAPWVLAIVIVLLGLEWILRKRNGLA